MKLKRSQLRKMIKEERSIGDWEGLLDYAKDLKADAEDDADLEDVKVYIKAAKLMKAGNAIKLAKFIDVQDTTVRETITDMFGAAASLPDTNEKPPETPNLPSDVIVAGEKFFTTILNHKDSYSSDGPITKWLDRLIKHQNAAIKEDPAKEQKIWLKKLVALKKHAIVYKKETEKLQKEFEKLTKTVSR